MKAILLTPPPAAKNKVDTTQIHTPNLSKH